MNKRIEGASVHANIYDMGTIACSARTRNTAGHRETPVRTKHRCDAHAVDGEAATSLKSRLLVVSAVRPIHAEPAIPGAEDEQFGLRRVGLQREDGGHSGADHVDKRVVVALISVALRPPDVHFSFCVAAVHSGLVGEHNAVDVRVVRVPA